MGIVYIGDRSVGKTHLALELANPRSQCVKVVSPDYEYLKSILGNDEDSTKPTNLIDLKPIEVQAQLRSGRKNVVIDWIDTPGEMWRDRWQKDNPDKWKAVLENMRQSEGILLVLSPHRGQLSSDIASEYSNEIQWCNRFDKWVDFFKDQCPKARHIVLCLNKADLITSVDLKQESAKLAFNPNGSSMSWRDRHTHVLQKYFRPIRPQIEQINKNTAGLSVQCFITSIHDRPLLELPWIYLASFLAK